MWLSLLISDSANHAKVAHPQRRPCCACGSYQHGGHGLSFSLRRGQACRVRRQSEQPLLADQAEALSACLEDCRQQIDCDGLALAP